MALTSLAPALPPAHACACTLCPGTAPSPWRRLQVEGTLIRGLLALIDRERQGDAVDRALLASLLRCLGDLGLYGSNFESR